MNPNFQINNNTNNYIKNNNQNNLNQNQELLTLMDVYNNNIQPNINPSYSKNTKNIFNETDLKIKSLKEFLSSIPNAKISHGLLIEDFRKITGQSVFNQICIATAGLVGSNEASVGNDLLTHNFRALLSLKDRENRDPIQKLLDYLNNQREVIQAIEEIEILMKAPSLEKFEKLSQEQRGPYVSVSGKSQKN